MLQLTLRQRKEGRDACKCGVDTINRSLHRQALMHDENGERGKEEAKKELKQAFPQGGNFDERTT